MRVEKDCGSECPSVRRRSFGNCIINSCALEAEKQEWRGSTLSSSAPASPACSDDEEEDCDGAIAVAGRNLTEKLLGTSLCMQSGLATSESSLDSKCSLEDYLKHRKVPSNPTCFSPHSIPAFRAPNGFSRPVPVLKFHPDDNSLSQTSDCVDLAHAEDDHSDSGFPSTSTSRKASVSASLTKSSSVSQDSLPQLDGCPSELEISTSDVNISLQKSRSLESLLDSYEEDSLKDILHSTLAEISRFSASLQSIDSVFSTEEEEEEEEESSLQFHGDFELSGCSNSEISFGLQHSFDSGASLPPLPLSRARRALYAEAQESEHTTERLTSISDISITISENEKLSEVHPRWVRRSQSYCVGSASSQKRNILRRKKRSDPAVVIQNVHTDEHKEEAVTPYEQLHRYQMSSLGCCSGAEARPQLRTLLSDSTHNSEAVNYKLSCEREPVHHCN